MHAGSKSPVLFPTHDLFSYCMPILMALCSAAEAATVYTDAATEAAKLNRANSPPEAKKLPTAS